MTHAKVAIVKASKSPDEQEIEATVRKAIELVGGLTDIVKSGDQVLIKPNLCMAFPAATTDPIVCKAIADMVHEIGAKPVIGDSSAIGYDTEETIQKGGYDRLRKEGYAVIDLKKKGIETIKVTIPNGKSLKEAILPKIVVAANVIIDVPKMKTHDQTIATLSIKNLKGCLPDTYKRKLHHVLGVFQSCADLTTVIRPALSVVDGIVAMEGLGPALGDPVEMDLIIAGRDLVAVDAVTIAIMGFEPIEDGCIRAAVESGIGTAILDKIKVLGEPIAKVQRRFKLAEEVMANIPFPEDFQLLMDEKACTGCKLTLMEAFMDVQKANQLDKTAGWTVIAGKLDKLPDIDKNKLLLIGACTAKYRNEGVFVEGCPPNNPDVCESFRAMGIHLSSRYRLRIG